MYLDLVDEIHVNRKLMRVVGIETAIYWTELISISKQVVKKSTYDEKGFFKLDRAYVERETTLTPEVQLVCDQTLVHFGALLVDPDDPNKIAIGINKIISLIAEEDPALLKQEAAKPKLSAKEKSEAKKNGMKFNLKNAVVEPDMELKKSYDTWVESMIDAANCRFTKAVVELFVKTVRAYSTDKKAQLRVIELATINTYKDASWAINLYEREKKPFNRQSAASKAALPEQKVCSGVMEDITF